MRFLLVGVSFAQGATAIITKGLPQRARVGLVAQPDNPYDANAVRVVVPRGSVVESDELAEALAAFGLSVAAMEWPFGVGHLGAKYETKAAKAAIAEGLQFHLVTDWHGLGGDSRSDGHLVQYPNGTCLVEVGGVK